MNTSNLTESFKYNVTNPETPIGLFQQSNEFMGGGFMLGIVTVFWLVLFFSLSKRNYGMLPSAIAANLGGSFASFILFLGGFMGSGVPLLFIVASAGTLFLQFVQER